MAEETGAQRFTGAPMCLRRPSFAQWWIYKKREVLKQQKYHHLAKSNQYLSNTWQKPMKQLSKTYQEPIKIYQHLQFWYVLSNETWVKHMLKTLNQSSLCFKRIQALYSPTSGQGLFKRSDTDSPQKWQGQVLGRRQSPIYTIWCFTLRMGGRKNVWFNATFWKPSSGLPWICYHFDHFVVSPFWVFHICSYVSHRDTMDFAGKP